MNLRPEDSAIVFGWNTASYR